jgi:hypothetical protein
MSKKAFKNIAIEQSSFSQFSIKHILSFFVLKVVAGYNGKYKYTLLNK